MDIKHRTEPRLEKEARFHAVLSCRGMNAGCRRWLLTWSAPSHTVGYAACLTAKSHKLVPVSRARHAQHQTRSACKNNLLFQCILIILGSFYNIFPYPERQRFFKPSTAVAVEGYAGCKQRSSSRFPHAPQSRIRKRAGRYFPHVLRGIAKSCKR